jgi:hypothetical protein
MHQVPRDTVDLERHPAWQFKGNYRGCAAWPSRKSKHPDLRTRIHGLARIPSLPWWTPRAEVQADRITLRGACGECLRPIVKQLLTRTPAQEPERFTKRVSEMPLWPGVEHPGGSPQSHS